MPEDHVVALGLLTERDVRVLGPEFDRLYPIEETADFDALLRAIDDADHKNRNKGLGLAHRR